jgi:hypothetical protein
MPLGTNSNCLPPGAAKDKDSKNEEKKKNSTYHTIFSWSIIFQQP